MGFNMDWLKRGRHESVASVRRKGRRLFSRTTALLTAGAMLAGGGVLAFAGGGSGSAGGGGGDGGGNFWQGWAYKDNNDGGWGNDLAAVQRAVKSTGVEWDSSGPANTYATQALNEAKTECSTRFDQAHPDQRGRANCRVVGVGFVAYKASNNKWTYQGVATASRSYWHDNWYNKIANGNTWRNNGAEYTTAQAFSDEKSMTVNKLAEKVFGDAGKTSISVIVLNQYEPGGVPAYKLGVTTKAASNGASVGSNTAVHDVITTTGGQSGTNVTANVSLHYDGHPAGLYKAAKATQSVAVSTAGSTNSPSFTPANFGMKEGWPEGTYWFDVQVAKQGNMSAAVDTPDREASETFTLKAIPPDKPHKTITPGTSADGMTNRTTIRFDTGTGGYRATIRDVIDPQGVTYTANNFKLIDTSDNNKDVSAQWTIGFDKKTNTVSAVWKGRFMPNKHTLEFSFDVTVSKPKGDPVKDKADYAWNQNPAVDTESREFPTFKPNPDKSWILYQDGKWAAVIDPDESNKTGADDHVFLDGDKVGSVVNGTIGANLAQAPAKLTLTDDWSKAAYIFKADDVKAMRVYEADATTDKQSSVADIVNTGKDVTAQWTITVSGSKATATANKEYLAGLKGLKAPKQVTLLIPGTISFASGKGASQVRKDFGKKPGDELTFCTAPGDTAGANGASLTNSGSQTLNGAVEQTNEPKICGYVPPVVKDVIGEGSEGGDQASVDGKVVYPGQKVEYQLTTQPNLPAGLAYTVGKVAFTDTYDQYLTPDKQTVEMMDLASGKVVPKTKYDTKWDEAKHLFQLTVTDQALLEEWKAGANPRVQIRFEGTVAKDAPGDHKVNNQWMLTLNNSLTPSNEVFNLPPNFQPSKADNQSAEQGDPTISIDGKTLMMGDTGQYVVTLDARQKDQAYKVWRLGISDDYDDEYVDVDPAKIEVLGADGKDYTKAFNIQVRDGVAYVYARTVDTKVPATGETVKGDPQPEDLKAYAANTTHDALKDPAIDQTLLGQTYQVILPYKVIKVTDGYVVKNTATQLVNQVSKTTNQVSNPLKPINPVKDVVVKVNGASANGKSVYKDSTFLYRLDSSVIPANRAYQTVRNWSISDQLDPAYDKLTGQWAVYAARDLYQDGKVIAKKGDRIAGSDFDSSKLGGDLFDATLDPATGATEIRATDLYLQLVSADEAHEQAWTAYLQCTRVKTTDRHENVFTEHYNGHYTQSNIVWTRTPDLTPSLKIEKWDEKSGFPKGDRDDIKDALDNTKDGTVIVFTITNTSRDEDGHGAWFRAKDLKLTDRLTAGTGTVTDLKYPDDWDTLVLKPGQSVNVKGTLKGMTGTTHSDRASVTGTPLTECPVQDGHPFDPDTDATGEIPAGLKQVTVDGATRCASGEVTSNTDDWHGKRQPLSTTGAAMIGVIGVMIVLMTVGDIILIVRRGVRSDREAPQHAA